MATNTENEKRRRWRFVIPVVIAVLAIGVAWYQTNQQPPAAALVEVKVINIKTWSEYTGKSWSEHFPNVTIERQDTRQRAFASDGISTTIGDTFMVDPSKFNWR